MQSLDRLIMDELEAIDTFDKGTESDSFTSSFRIRTRLPRSRIFPVTSGSVTVSSFARWDRPAACPIREYYIELRKSEPWYRPDQSFGSVRFPVSRTASFIWRGLPSGNYYLEIWVANSNSNCVLLGDISVT